jgi:hypothetical protein
MNVVFLGKCSGDLNIVGLGAACLPYVAHPFRREHEGNNVFPFLLQGSTMPK